VSKSIRIIENFHSYQGEGPDAGKKMLFLRFKRCNRNCCWCDTQVRLRISNEFEYSIRDIQDSINEYNTNMCITGGEPTFGHNLNYTIDLINTIKCNLVNVETNGCDLVGLIEKVNKNKNVKYILSPKLFTDEDMIFYKDLLVKIKDNESVYIKLVYEERDMIIQFLDYLKETGFDTFRIFLMPEGVDRKTLLAHSPIVFDAAEKYKTNFSSREHIIYGFI